MKKPFFILCLFSISAHAQNNLPPCNGDLSQQLCFGVREYSDGKYVGQFRDHVAHGQGTYTFANGDKVVGQWRNGKFIQAQTPPPVIAAWTQPTDNERKKLEEERRQLAEERRNLEEEKRKLNTKR
jgi:MORN repeat